jgi:hypothetical protein
MSRDLRSHTTQGPLGLRASARMGFRLACVVCASTLLTPAAAWADDKQPPQAPLKAEKEPPPPAKKTRTVERTQITRTEVGRRPKGERLRVRARLDDARRYPYLFRGPGLPYSGVTLKGGSPPAAPAPPKAGYQYVTWPGFQSDMGNCSGL